MDVLEKPSIGQDQITPKGQDQNLNQAGENKQPDEIELGIDKATFIETGKAIEERSRRELGREAAAAIEPTRESDSFTFERTVYVDKKTGKRSAITFEGSAYPSVEIPPGSVIEERVSCDRYRGGSSVSVHYTHVDRENGDLVTKLDLSTDPNGDFINGKFLSDGHEEKGLLFAGLSFESNLKSGKVMAKAERMNEMPIPVAATNITQVLGRVNSLLRG